MSDNMSGNPQLTPEQAEVLDECRAAILRMADVGTPPEVAVTFLLKVCAEIAVASGLKREEWEEALRRVFVSAETAHLMRMMNSFQPKPGES